MEPWQVPGASHRNTEFRNFVACDRVIMHLEKAFGFGVPLTRQLQLHQLAEPGDCMHHLHAPHAARPCVMSIPAWLPQWISRMDSADKMIVCERGDLVMVFNFHPTNSYTGYKVFGGWKNVTKESDVAFCGDRGGHDCRLNSMLAYAPSRTVVVYAPAEECDKDADLKSWGIPGLAVKGLGPYHAH
ncbi:hypothetical protein QJQ45_000668 [Haematococcus lacustris]|nr:hypothetical protein QJQ45_000668 [Haematococcus lacustris]